MYGLAKIARDYSNDPVWNMINEDKEGKHQLHQEARDARDPELLDKEINAYSTGVAIGGTAGGVAGGALGAIDGVQTAVRGGGGKLGSVARGLGGMVAGGAIGAVGGAGLGALAAAPMGMKYHFQQDPEVRRQVSETGDNFRDAAERQEMYEVNNPLYGRSQMIAQKQRELQAQRGY